MYLLLGISILLAAMLSFNSLASLLASLLWRLLGRHTRNWPAAMQASTLFLLRVAPAAAGLACMIFLIGPAYAEHEPRSTTEGVSYKLALLALASAAGIALAIIRGFAAWRATARLTADWLSHAQPISVDGVKIPCYRIEHQFPVIAIVGILRPRLFIAHKVFEKLQPEEISGAIQHEIGHLIAQDNLKRGLLRACRDVLLIFPCGRSLDRRWSEASESAADEHAAATSCQVALDLASALVKIARMIPSGARPAMPAGVFLVGEESSGIRARVRRLVQLAGSERIPLRSEWLVRKSFLWLSLVSSVLFLILFSRENSILASVHSLIEHAVYFLN
jgi:Zn-dependent protease with chaperone function